MAVPLVDKGVVVVAVGYDIAPKGGVFTFLKNCCSSFEKHTFHMTMASTSVCLLYFR